jgi:hypothetical protein
MGLREVSATLWRERHLLELLLFKVDEEQLLVAAGRTRWLARAAGEVEMVREELRQTELQRAVEVSGVAVELGLPADASLRQLAAATPEPWRGMLAEHRQAFLALTDEVTAVRTQDAFAAVGSRHEQIEIMQERNQANPFEFQNEFSEALHPTLLDFLR